MTRGSTVRRGWSTRALLQCAAMAVLAAILLIGMSPLTGALAVLSPPAYALAGSVSVLGPLLAARWVRLPGAALLTALVAGVLSIPFTGLGWLILVALCAPAAAIDAVLLVGAFRRRPRELLWYGAATAGALVIFAVSLPVIDPAVLTPALVVLTLVARLAAYLVLAWAAVVLERALGRAGLRRPAAPNSERRR